MSNFLNLDDMEATQKINIDDLYEKNHIKDIKQLSIFQKILNRVHKRINTISRQNHDKYTWYQIPEFIFGESVYDKGHCIAFIVAKLEENGFKVQYIQPNILFISWEHWVPSYVRENIKKKTGIIVNEFGDVIENIHTKKEDEDEPINTNNTNKKTYASTREYKPTGKLIYTKDMFDRIDKKINSDGNGNKDL